MIPALALALGLLAEPAPSPRALFESGGEAFRQGRYPVAIEALEAAWRLDQRPSVVFSLAQCHRLQYFVAGQRANLERAVELYRAYLAEVAEGGRRDHAAQHLATLVPLLERAGAEAPEAPAALAPARLIITSAVEGATARVDGSAPQPIPATFEVQPGERRVVVEAPTWLPEARTTRAIAGSTVALSLDPEPVPARLTVEAPEGAQLRLDGREVGTSPLDAPVEVEPGRHVLFVHQRGRVPAVEPLDLGRGQAARLAVSLPMTGQRVGAWSLLVGGGAMAIAAGAFGGLALADDAEAESMERDLDAEGLSVRQADRYRDLEASRDERRNLAIGLGIGAGVALVSGALLYYFDLAPPPAGATLMGTSP